MTGWIARHRVEISSVGALARRLVQSSDHLTGPCSSVERSLAAATSR
jgi:hypothetical protein